MNLLAKSNRIILHRNTKQLLGIVRNSSNGFKENSKYPKTKSINSSSIDNNHEKPPGQAPKTEEFKSMWESPICDISLGIFPPVRFDALYYKPSNMANRTYQQTWVECPESRIKPAFVWEFPKDKYPPIVRRSRKSRPDTAKCLNTGKLDLLKCSREKDIKQNKACPKISLPGCRGIIKTVCGPRNCMIPPCPHPSFSERFKRKIIPKRPSECEFKIHSMSGI